MSNLIKVHAESQVQNVETNRRTERATRIAILVAVISAFLAVGQLWVQNERERSARPSRAERSLA